MEHQHNMTEIIKLIILQTRIVMSTENVILDEYSFNQFF